MEETFKERQKELLQQRDDFYRKEEERRTANNLHRALGIAIGYATGKLFSEILLNSLKGDDINET